MSRASLESQIIRLGEKHEIEKLRNIIDKNSVQAITTILTSKLGRNECITFWNYLLQGFNIKTHDGQEKRFSCVKFFLDSLLKKELSYKQTYDLITRLCQDLNSFSSAHLIEILEHCIDALRLGDPKCVGWKDLLPETLNILTNISNLSVNSVPTTGAEYRNTTVRNICTMRWPTQVLSPLADMLKALNLSATEVVTVLNKFAFALQSLEPAELPALAFQMFSMCTTAAQIIIPIFAFEKYFHRFYYKKLFADMESCSTDFDSIDAFSDKELREAEETILHHLGFCTQYKISEIQMAAVLKNFVSTPDVILTPFVLSAIITMTAVNRDPESRLISSALLQFLRAVIRHNEDERQLTEYSVWVRDSLQRRRVDLEQVFTVLIDQNKEGKDIITPGLVNLVFLLLKAKHSPPLNELANMFFTKFIRKRFMFGQGIVKKLAEWMVVEQDQYQFAECLVQLSVSDTFTVSECLKTINYTLDFFLWVPGEQAMRMMSFILPLLKISPLVRDALMETLRKAMHSSNMQTRRMAVYGFCMVLKQLSNNNAQRSQMGILGICTQNNLSGISLMSQATLGTRTNPQRHFDMLTLEIVGLLRNCFNENIEIKTTLYENLQRAVELNPKLVPHVLQFIDWNFRSYFELTETDDGEAGTQLKVHLEKTVRALDEEEYNIEVKDNLGTLILFVSHCLLIFEKFENEYNAREIYRLLDLSVEKVVAREINFEEMTVQSSAHMKNELIIQQVSFVEGLMAYSILTSRVSNDNVTQLLPLYKMRRKLMENLKYHATCSKKILKKKNASTETSANVTINGTPVHKLNVNASIWDCPVIEKMLRLLHEDIVPFAAQNKTSSLRCNSDLVRHVFHVAAEKVEHMRLEPLYKQLAHSRRMLKYLTDITKVVYERCIKRLPELWRDFDVEAASLAAETFRQCLLTANETYKKKFDIFLKGFDFAYGNKESVSMLQEVIDEFMREADSTEGEESLHKDTHGQHIPVALFECLEVLYENMSFGDKLTTDSYTWLLNFCVDHKLHNRELGLVHKLLFTQRQKTHAGSFFDIIAMQFGDLWHTISEEPQQQQEDNDEDNLPTQAPIKLKSIGEQTAESCIHYLYAAVRKQIDDVEYFVGKANNLSYKCRIVPEDDRDMCIASLRSLERSISTQLVHISNTLLRLTNVCLPLGGIMDGLMKLLMHHYTCLKNWAKHFLICHANNNCTIKGTRFDLLLKIVGKALPRNVYNLIPYIEYNILDEPNTDKKKNKQKKPDPQADRAKVLRETKLIPKIILYIENFNTQVIVLSKKTNDRLAHFLHQGVVRDFRVKTSDLKAAIERTLSKSSQISQATTTADDTDNDASSNHSDDENEVEKQPAHSPDKDNSDDEIDNRENIPSTRRVGRKRTQHPTVESSDEESVEHAEADETAATVSTTPDDTPTLRHESIHESETQLEKNLVKINKRAKKRTLKESENNDPDTATAPMLPPQTKKRRSRPVRK